MVMATARGGCVTTKRQSLTSPPPKACLIPSEAEALAGNSEGFLLASASVRVWPVENRDEVIFSQHNVTFRGQYQIAFPPP